MMRAAPNHNGFVRPPAPISLLPTRNVRACFSLSRSTQLHGSGAVPSLPNFPQPDGYPLSDDHEQGPARYDVHCVICQERETQCRCYEARAHSIPLRPACRESSSGVCVEHANSLLQRREVVHLGRLITCRSWVRIPPLLPNSSARAEMARECQRPGRCVALETISTSSGVDRTRGHVGLTLRSEHGASASAACIGELPRVGIKPGLDVDPFNHCKRCGYRIGCCVCDIAFPPQHTPGASECIPRAAAVLLAANVSRASRCSSRSGVFTC